MRDGRRERGHLMVGLMAALAILLIFSTVATQAWVDMIRRDNEAEMMFRGQELARAIYRFRKDQNRLPSELEELMQPGTKGQYFLRRLYKDPLVKDGEWGLIYQGPGGGLVDPNTPGYDPDALGTTSRRATDPMGGLSSRYGDGARQMQGLPIVGVKSLCEDQPFRVYKGHENYSEWKFTVFDIEPAAAQRGAGAGGVPGGTPATGARPQPTPGGSPGAAPGRPPDGAPGGASGGAQGGGGR
jgi:type II secretory pathway pseudopilin PulG